MTEKIKPIVFHFEEGTHKYYLNDELLPGVTTILGTLAKPALIQWAANEACKYIEAHLITRAFPHLDEGVYNPEEFATVLAEAKTAHAKKRDKAADQGTDVHTEIEKWIKDAIEGRVSLLNENKQVQKFITWAVENNVQFHESEKKMYSVEHRFAGTCDFTATIGGKKYVGDLKTTSGIYDLSPFLQCAAYRIMLTEMGDTGFVGSVIIRLGKDGAFEEFYRSDETGEDMETFLALLKVYKAMARFKKSN